MIAQEFSFFRLSLEKFLNENHSPKIKDVDFIINRCNEAEEAYLNHITSGGSPITALEIANTVLFSDLYFFKYNILRDVVLEEFPEEIKEEEHEDYILKLLPYCEDVFNNYPLENNERDSSYSLLYTELIGAVTIYLEDHHVV